MNAKCVTPIVGLVWVCIFGLAHASDDNPELSSVDCGECHGDDGNSTHPLSPSLAGQNTAYLIQQLTSFLNGTRQHPLIGAGGEQLSDSKIKALSGYYSSQKPTNTGIQSIENHSTLNTSIMLGDSDRDTLEQIIKHGESFYSTCSGCHGVEGEGVAPYPRLAGQQPEYLSRQLINFKTGERNSTIMKMMVINLSDEDINAIAIYLTTLSDENHQLALSNMK